MFAFLDVPVAGAFHLIDPLISLLTPIVGGAAVAIAVVLFTCVVRLLLHPLARAAVRGERARAVLAPKIAELRYLAYFPVLVATILPLAAVSIS